MAVPCAAVRLAAEDAGDDDAGAVTVVVTVPPHAARVKTASRPVIAGRMTPFSLRRVIRLPR
jgi:hypothetical protein